MLKKNDEEKKPDAGTLADESKNADRVAELEKQLAASQAALNDSEHERGLLKQGLEDEKKAREELELENTKLDEHAAQMEKSEQKRQRAEKKRKIIIAEGANGVNDDVFVSVQAVPYLVKRGVEVEVPESVYQTLKTSAYSVYDEVGDGDDIEYKERKVPRFNISVVE